jgi:hypothetical protein
VNGTRHRIGTASTTLRCLLLRVRRQLSSGACAKTIAGNGAGGWPLLLCASMRIMPRARLRVVLYQQHTRLRAAAATCYACLPWQLAGSCHVA